LRSTLSLRLRCSILDILRDELVDQVDDLLRTLDLLEEPIRIPSRLLKLLADAFALNEAGAVLRADTIGRHEDFLKDIHDRDDVFRLRRLAALLITFELLTDGVEALDLLLDI